MNYGKVVHQKKDLNGNYIDYDKLTMQYSGQVDCVNNWSNEVDFKTLNNGFAWSNLSVVAFISNQYDLEVNGIATSTNIEKAWVGDPSEQRMKFRVIGGVKQRTTVTLPQTTIGTPQHYTSYFIIYDVVDIDFSILNKAYSGSLLYMQVDNQSPILIHASSTNSYTFSYKKTFTIKSTVKFFCNDVSSLSRYVFDGSYIQESTLNSVMFNAKLQWIAIGNS